MTDPIINVYGHKIHLDGVSRIDMAMTPVPHLVIRFDNVPSAANAVYIDSASCLPQTSSNKLCPTPEEQLREFLDVSRDVMAAWHSHVLARKFGEKDISNSHSADVGIIKDDEDNARQILNIFGCLNVVDNRLTDLERSAEGAYEATKNLRAMERTINDRLVRLEGAAQTLAQLEEKLDKLATDFAKNAARNEQVENASRQHGLNVLDLYEKYETVFIMSIALPIIACVICWITDWIVK